jgi:AraC-like DNA-binding protein
LTRGDSRLIFETAGRLPGAELRILTTTRRISVAAATGFADAITASGANPEEVLREVGVKRSVLGNPDAFLPSSAFTALLEEASRLTRDECFGLHFGERFDPKDIGALAYLVFNSPNVTSAMQNIERYLRIHNSAARVAFTIEGERGYLRYITTAEETTCPTRQHNEYSMALAMKTLRLLTGTRFLPVTVQFAHPAPASTAEHRRAFECPVDFGCPMNALVVGGDFLRRIAAAADERLYRVLKQHVERLIAEMPRDDDLLFAVKRAIFESMAMGGPRREQIAKELAMSARTLERRLKDRGVVYKKLVNDLRGEMARDYLKERGRSVTEVAFLLGYSEVSAFNRAFKRGTGMTPLEYRLSASTAASSSYPD